MLAVTGITGHTGRFFLHELSEGHYSGPIKCLVRNTNCVDSLTESGLNIEIVQGSLEDEYSVRALLSGADTVVHIANIHYSPNIVRIGMECGVNRFILVHTTGIYSKYKSAAEEYIAIENQIKPLMKEKNITISRPTMIFGDMKDYNISKFIRLVDKLPLLPVVGRGDSLIQPVNARDLGKALYAVLFSEKTFGKGYDLSGEKAISVRQLYLTIADMLNKRRRIACIPMGLCVFGAKTLRLLTLGKINLIEKVQRMGEDRSYSHHPAAEDFGYAPEPFKIGLEREIKEYLAIKNE